MCVPELYNKGLSSLFLSCTETGTDTQSSKLKATDWDFGNYSIVISILDIYSLILEEYNVSIPHVLSTTVGLSLPNIFTCLILGIRRLKAIYTESMNVDMQNVLGLYQKVD